MRFAKFRARRSLGQRDQVIVVHPDDVVRLQDLHQLIREMFVDPHIAGQVAPREFREIEPVMEDRPQHPVGETVVILVKILRLEVGDDIGVVALC